VQPGSVTFVQRFGGSINLNLHVHMIFLEGVYEDRSIQGLKPRFRPQELPRDEAPELARTMAASVQHRIAFGE
jgi:hypothetical protein